MTQAGLRSSAIALRRRQLIGGLAVVAGVAVCAGEATWAADVDIAASTDNGIVLDSFVGATVQVLAGVTVANTNLVFSCPTPPPPGAKSIAALCATTQAWTVTNLGSIGGATFGDGVHFTDGGAITNAGSISGDVNGIWMQGGAGASVDNQLGATISGGSGGIVIGDISPVAGIVTNAGTIASDGQAIGLRDGGLVTNLATGLIEGHGESNAVAVVQGASREVINSGTIQSNDAGFATGVVLEHGVLINNAGGRILGAYNGVFASGSGATDITNDGLIEASKAGAMFGTPGSAIEADGGGSIVNSGIIRSTSADDSDVGIYFTGAGSITNGGTIESLDGGLAISFNGSDTHTLTLETGSVLSGSVQGGSGIDNLVLKGKGSEAVDKFLDFETLSLQGADWTLTGAGSFLTSADVESGHLHVNGVLTVPTLSVLAGGTLGGVGDIIGAVDNAGVIAPGNSIGTLTASSVSFGPHALLEVQIDPMTADKLVVTGTATLDPTAMVRVLPASGTYVDGKEYLILDAGTRNGTFGGIIENSAFLDFALDNSKDPNQVWLDITEVATFPDVAETPNQKAAAMGLDALGPGNPIFDAIVLLDASDARRAFDLTSGEVHPSVASDLVDDSRFIREAAIDRLRDRFDAAFSPADPSLPALSTMDDADGSPGDRPLASSGGGTVWTSWGHGFGSWGDFQGDGNAGSLDRSIGGFVAGADATVAETWRLGLAGGYQSTGLSVPERDSSASIAAYDLAAYGGFERGPMTVRLGAAYTWYDVNTDRTVVIPGYSDSLSAAYHAHTAQAFGELGYDARAGGFEVEPFAGLAYVNLATDSFTEKGGPAALTGAASDEDTIFTNLGARFGFAMPFAGKPATVRGMVAWQHALDNLAPASTLSFNGGAGLPFTILGIPIAADALRLEAGLDWSLSDRAKLALAYSGQIAAGVEDHGLTAKLTASF